MTVLFAYDSLLVVITNHITEASCTQRPEQEKQHTHTVGFLDSVPCGICLLNAFHWNTFIIYGEIGSDCTATPAPRPHPIPPPSPALSPPAPVSVNHPHSLNNNPIALSHTMAKQ